MERLFKALAEVGPRVVFGEVLHARGLNLPRLSNAGVSVAIGPSVDREVGQVFEKLLREFSLQGAYWYER